MFKRVSRVLVMITSVAAAIVLLGYVVFVILVGVHDVRADRQHADLSAAASAAEAGACVQISAEMQQPRLVPLYTVGPIVEENFACVSEIPERSGTVMVFKVQPPPCSHAAILRESEVVKHQLLGGYSDQLLTACGV